MVNLTYIYLMPTLCDGKLPQEIEYAVSQIYNNVIYTSWPVPTHGEIHVLIFRKLASSVIGLKVSYSNITVKGSHCGEKSYFSDSECSHKLQIFGLVT